MVASFAMWQVIDSGTQSAQENMRFDAELLDTLNEESPCILHLYEWDKRSITFGYFIDPALFLNHKGLLKHNIGMARRPTGGGIVFHLWDMAFSVLIPQRLAKSTLENYAMVNTAVLRAARDFLGMEQAISLTPFDLSSLDSASEKFCMSRPTKYDVMLDGRKIAGAAQRRRKNGFLHQGTIALMMPPKELLEELLLPESRVYEGAFKYTYPLLGQNATEKEMPESKKLLGQLLIKQLEETIHE